METSKHKHPLSRKEAKLWYQTIAQYPFCDLQVNYASVASLAGYCPSSSIIRTAWVCSRPVLCNAVTYSSLRLGHLVGCRDKIDVVYLDFIKAFDCVPHDRLLHQLSLSVSKVLYMRSLQTTLIQDPNRWLLTECSLRGHP